MIGVYIVHESTLESAISGAGRCLGTFSQFNILPQKGGGWCFGVDVLSEPYGSKEKLFPSADALECRIYMT